MTGKLGLSGRRWAGQRALFVNDCGFVGGAGIGLKRQVQSFLLAGFDVRVLCWMREEADILREPRSGTYPGRFLGIERHPEIHRTAGISRMAITRRVFDAILENQPDIVIFGNLHWAGWPIDVIQEVRNASIPVIAYLHDTHWITGRCAYTGGCELYRECCDERCPTPTDYPPLRPDRIASAWHERRAVFTGPKLVPIATNSAWLTRLATEGFSGSANVSTIWLGLDASLFRPFSRSLARRLLELPENLTIALCGAVNLGEERKGGSMLRRIVAELKSEPSFMLLGFGHNSQAYDGIRGVGNIVDERLMPLLFAAADFMINAAQEEAFGQTLMEASACGIPIVATDVGGVSDVARRGENAILVQYGDVDGMLAGIRKLKTDVALRRQMGDAARAIVEADFTLSQQADAWSARIEGILGSAGRPSLTA